MDCGSVGLLSLHTLNIDDILFPVDLDHFANLLALVVSTNDLDGDSIKRLPFSTPTVTNITQTTAAYLDFVIFADGHGPHVVLLAELLRQRGRHDLPPDV